MMMETSRVDLLRDHAAIEMLATRLAAEIDRNAEPATLALTLDHLVTTVADHLAVEDAMIYELAMRASPGAHPARIEGVRREFERLKANWGEYLTRWSADAIAGDREGFVQASRAMLPRLRDRVQLENRLLAEIGHRAG